MLGLLVAVVAPARCRISCRSLSRFVCVLCGWLHRGVGDLFVCVVFERDDDDNVTTGATTTGSQVRCRVRCGLRWHSADRPAQDDCDDVQSRVAPTVPQLCGGCGGLLEGACVLVCARYCALIVKVCVCVCVCVRARVRA